MSSMYVNVLSADYSNFLFCPYFWAYRSLFVSSTFLIWILTNTNLQQSQQSCKAALPVRVLVPVSYTTIRLALIWEWVLSSFTMSSIFHFSGRLLAIANLAFALMHLFGFLLPIAIMKYLRVHFFCVEAKEVTVREGYEDGLLLWNLRHYVQMIYTSNVINHWSVDGLIVSQWMNQFIQVVTCHESCVQVWIKLR